ncbi:MAG: tetratricopeptide repeat protein [Pseudomonadota bacterium]
MKRRDALTATGGQIGKRHAPVWLVAGLALALAGCATTDTMTDDEAAQAQVPEISQEKLDRAVALAGQAVLEERWDDAKRIIERVLYHDPEDPEAFYLLAEVHLAEGHYQRAAEEFAQLTAIPELSAGAHQGLGLVLLMQGQEGQARTNLQKAVELDPSLWRAWNGLGYQHDLAEDWAASSEAYSRALEHNPKSAFVYNNRGYSYLMQARYDEAIADLGTALRLDSDFDLAKANLRLALAWKGNYALAMTGMREEEKSEVLNNIGFVALMRHDYSAAETYLMQAVESDASLNQTARRNLALLRNLNEINAMQAESAQTAEQSEAKASLAGVPATMPAGPPVLAE